MADIAAAADIAPRTFFAYFPSKEAVVFHDFDALFESLQERDRGAAGGRDGDRRAAQLARGRDAGEHAESEDAELRKRMCLDEPAWPRTSSTCCPSSRSMLRVGVARDLGEPADGLRPKLVAAAAARDRDRRRERGQGAVDAVLDETLIFLRGGVAALQERG